MKWIRIIVIIVLLALVAPSTADILYPNNGSNNGTGNGEAVVAIQHYFVIENEKQYPGYIFGLYPLPHGGGDFWSFEFLHNCWNGGYHLAAPTISVMNRTRYYTLAQSKKDIRDESIIFSNYYVFGGEYAAKAENRASRTDVLTITTLNSTHLVVKNSRAFYTNLDGHTEEIPLNDPATKTTDGNPFTMYQYFLLPLLALGVIAAILIRRYKQ